jgi:probable rRNA maturation factor
VRKFRRRARRLQKLLEVDDRELSILLTDDTEMTGLNRAYRRRDRTTDVLSFSQQEGPRGDLHPEILGDVVISVPAAKRQARERGASLMSELTVLLVHGVLHLLGFEHEKAGRARARAMRKEQERLVQLLEGRSR